MQEELQPSPETTPVSSHPSEPTLSPSPQTGSQAVFKVFGTSPVEQVEQVSWEVEDPPEQT